MTIHTTHRLIAAAGILAGITALAAYLPPAGPRLARSLSDAQVARAVTNAPAGARVSVPMHRARPWYSGILWQAGQVATYSNAVYVCVQAHHAQAAWRPPIVPALWRLVRAATDTPGQPPAWRQPLGAHDAYAKGARVTHAGAVWASTIAANVWEPGVTGWTKEAP